MIYQGDDTGAFGDVFLTISIRLEEGQVMPEFSKAELKVGGVCKEFRNPSFPLTVNFDSKETLLFNAKNTAYLAVWDKQGRKRTKGISRVYSRGFKVHGDGN